jgi:RHS repeat-associated protein
VTWQSGNLGECPNGAAFCSTAPTGGYVYFAGKMIMEPGGAVATDRLGSVRSGIAYYPWGEEMTSTPNLQLKFGTYFRDAVGQDYADQRYYTSNAGRFNTADPAGNKAVDPKNPTSWNMYTYAGDDPVNFNDPRGLYELASGGSGDPWFGADNCTVNGLIDVPGPLCGYTDIGPLGSPVYEVPSCDELLLDAISDFLSGRGSSLAAYTDTIVLVGQKDNVDPTLIAAIGIAENGQAKNNPFALGPNGSSTYPTLNAAVSAVGATLDKYIYTWNESTVSALWSGNTWQVDPKKPWVTVQPPGYCVGTTAAGVAGCQNTGRTISNFMQTIGVTATVGGNPNKLGFPCPD